MVNISDLINKLKEKRKVFHSEDDLKLALSMEIIINHPDCKVRLERPVGIQMVDWNKESLEVRAPIDIVIIERDGYVIPIELKYKTKKTELECENEKYQLTEHGAVDIGRYSFRKDIYRIEKYLASQPDAKIGYVLILTNDSAYSETDVSTKDNFDKFLSFHDGTKINSEDKGWNYIKINKEKFELRQGDKRWWHKDKNEVHWTCNKELFYRLDLNTGYVVHWITYSTLKETEFKYCLIQVEKK